MKNFFRGFKIFRGGVGVCAPYGFDFWRGGSKHPLRTLDGCADLLGGGVKPDFEFLGGVQRTLRTLVPTYAPPLLNLLGMLGMG